MVDRVLESLSISPRIKKKMLKSFLYPVMFLLALFHVGVLHATPLKTLSLDFTRELTENNKTEHIEGTLHYEVQATRIVVEVTQPLQQIMVVKDNVLEIYYLVEKQAFRFISQGRVPLPFVESIIHSTQAEYGLTAIGYTLDQHDVVGEVLYTYWTPPEKAKDELGRIILGMRDDRLISAEVKNSKGHIIGRSRYENHSKVGASYIPMTITSSTFGEKSEVLQREKIVYSNPEINMETSKTMLNFVIPESVEVKEIKW